MKVFRAGIFFNRYQAAFYASRNASKNKKPVEFRTEFDKKWTQNKMAVVQASSKLTAIEFTNLLQKLKDSKSVESKRVLDSQAATHFFEGIPNRLPKMPTEDFLHLVSLFSTSKELSDRAPSLPRLWAMLEMEALKRTYLCNIDQLTILVRSFALAGRGSKEFFATIEDVILDNRDEIAAHTQPFQILDDLLWAYSTTNTGSTTFYAELSFTIENLAKRIGGGRATLLNAVHMSRIVNYYSRTTSSIQGAFKLYSLTEEIIERNLKKMDLSEVVRITENLFPQKIGKNAFLQKIEQKILEFLKTKDDDHQFIVFPDKAKNVVQIPDCISLFKSMCTHRFNEPELLLTLMRKIARNAGSLTIVQLETILWSFVRGRHRGELYNVLEREFSSRLGLAKPRGLAFSFENFMAYGRISPELFEKFLPEIEKNLDKMDIHYKLKVVNGLYHAYYLPKLYKSKEKCESLAKEIVKTIAKTARFFHQESTDRISKMKYKDILRFLGLLSEHPVHIRTQEEIPKLIEAMEETLNKLFEKAYLNQENIPINPKGLEVASQMAIEQEDFEGEGEEGLTVMEGEEDKTWEEKEREVDQDLKQSRMNVDFDDLCTVYNLFVRLNMGSEEFIGKLEMTITRSVVRVPKHLFCETMHSLLERNKHSHLVKFYPMIQELTRYGEVKEFFSHESYCLMLYSLINSELVLQGNVKRESIIRLKERVCTLLQKNFKDIVEDLLEMSCRAFSPSLLRVYLSTLLIYSSYSEVNHWEEIMNKVQTELAEGEEGKEETSNPLRELLLRNEPSTLTQAEFITGVGEVFESELLKAGVLKNNEYFRSFRVLDQFLHGLDVTWMTTTKNEASNRIVLCVLNETMRVKSGLNESFSATNVSALGHQRSIKVKLFLLKYLLGWQVYVVDASFCQNDPEKAREPLRRAIKSKMNAKDEEDDENDVDVLGNARGRRNIKIKKTKFHKVASK